MIRRALIPSVLLALACSPQKSPEPMEGLDPAPVTTEEAAEGEPPGAPAAEAQHQASPASPSPRQDVDDSTLKELEALGYVDHSGVAAGSGSAAAKGEAGNVTAPTTSTSPAGNKDKAAPAKEFNTKIPSGRSYQEVGQTAAGVVGGDKPAEKPMVADLKGGEEYTDHGVNPYTMPEEDRFSTFSIDVDTASYSISRRKLQQEGSLPPIASVRVEEFVNYADYDYPQPDGKDPFAVSMEAMPDPFRSGHHVLRVGIQGKEVPRSERKPIHLVFLVDVSGSMSSPDKLGLAKDSLQKLVSGLREDDTVGLCTYAGRVARILEPTSAGNVRQIRDAIQSLESGGSTSMSAGIDIAYQMAMEQFKPGHENRVVILSDGDANVGARSWDEMLSQIKVHADQGVTLSTVGFGMGNYRDTLMEQLANKGDGNNYYIDSEQQAHRVFVDEFGGTLVTIARDVKIQVEMNPEAIAAWRLIGYENRDIADKDFRNDRVDAGEVGAGHEVTALYDVILKDGYAPELATVRLRWEQPGADSKATERSYGFGRADLVQGLTSASRETRIAYASATFAEVLRQSPHVQELSLEPVIRLAQGAARPGEKDDQELIALMQRARQLGAGGQSAAITRR
jgi:Ca-activated chloride channel homolog